MIRAVRSNALLKLFLLLLLFALLIVSGHVNISSNKNNHLTLKKRSKITFLNPKRQQERIRLLFHQKRGHVEITAKMAAISISRGGGGGGGSDQSSSATVSSLLQLNVAKVGTIVEAVHAAFVCLAPKMCLELLYGVTEDNANPLLEWATRRVGIGLANHAIVSLFTFFGASSKLSSSSSLSSSTILRACGYGFLPWVAVFSTALVNNDAKRLGLKPILNAAQCGALGMCSLGAYAGIFGNASSYYAPKVVKVISIMMILEGVRLASAPGASGEVLGFPSNPSQDYLSLLHGISLASSGLFMIGLISSSSSSAKTSMNVYGYSLLPYVGSYVASFFISHDFDKMGIPQGPHLAWFVAILTAVGVTTLSPCSASS